MNRSNGLLGSASLVKCTEKALHIALSAGVAEGLAGKVAVENDLCFEFESGIEICRNGSRADVVHYDGRQYPTTFRIQINYLLALLSTTSLARLPDR